MVPERGGEHVASRKKCRRQGCCCCCFVVVIHRRCSLSLFTCVRLCRLCTLQEDNEALRSAAEGSESKQVKSTVAMARLNEQLHTEIQTLTTRLEAEASAHAAALRASEKHVGSLQQEVTALCQQCDAVAAAEATLRTEVAEVTRQRDTLLVSCCRDMQMECARPLPAAFVCCGGLQSIAPPSTHTLTRTDRC